MSQVLLNLLAITACAVLAHVLPETTLLGAYAILGPAHYLTEISWLHDRQYFVKRPRALLLVALAALVVMLVRPHTPEAAGALFALLGGLIAAGLGARFIAVGATAVVSALAGVTGAVYGWFWVAVLVVLVPTLIHVFVFTGMFMLTGAMRSKRLVEWLPLLALALGALSFLVIPTVDLGHGLFKTAVMQNIAYEYTHLSMPGHDIAWGLVGFLGFAYAYHYLNWFLKTGLLGWHRMPLWRLVLLTTTWVVILYAYTQDVFFGLLISLPLSLGHVLLELPLDVLTARRLLSTPFLRHRSTAS